MGNWAAIILLIGATYALVLLQRISRQIEAVDEKLGDLLAHDGVKGYETDPD
jgi:hypothetical protein